VDGNVCLFSCSPLSSRSFLSDLPSPLPLFRFQIGRPGHTINNDALAVQMAASMAGYVQVSLVSLLPSSTLLLSLPSSLSLPTLSLPLPSFSSSSLITYQELGLRVLSHKLMAPYGCDFEWKVDISLRFLFIVTFCADFRVLL
jgi:hypothetical protein